MAVIEAIRLVIPMTLIRREASFVLWLCMWHSHMLISSDMAGNEPGTAVFCCPDVDTINVFRIEVVQPDENEGLKS